MSLAITNGTLIDGSGGDPQSSVTILIEGERITRAIPFSGAKVPPDRKKNETNFLLHFTVSFALCQVVLPYRTLQAIRIFHHWNKWA
jgi:hypothetical protein